MRNYSITVEQAIKIAKKRNGMFKMSLLEIFATK